MVYALIGAVLGIVYFIGFLSAVLTTATPFSVDLVAVGLVSAAVLASSITLFVSYFDRKGTDSLTND